MAVGTQIGNYSLKRKLARGGMADIFLATRPGQDGEQLFVVKMILPERLRDPQALKLFLGEARLAKMLRHPNIVQIVTLDRIDNYFYIAMEYVAGETLHAMLLRAAQRKLRISPRQCAAIVRQACQGLAYAHELTAPDGQPLKIVHRDISPSNMMLSYDGCVKLLDFGIAAARIRRAGFPQGKALGKRGYMSPEQCRGNDVDLRSDIFSLGVVFWELLAGGSLFSTLPAEQMSAAILSGQVERPSRYCPGLDTAIEEVVMKALQVDRQRRYQSALQMEAAILQAVPDLPGEQELAQMLRELFSADQELRSRRGECGEPIDLETLLFDDLQAQPPPRHPLQRPQAAFLSPFTKVFLLLVALLLGAAMALLLWASTPDRTPAPAPGPAVDNLLGTLQVDSSPRGADITIDGRATGKTTPATFTGLPLDRRLQITLSKDGFRTWTGTVMLENDISRRMYTMLQRAGQ